MKCSFTLDDYTIVFIVVGEIAILNLLMENQLIFDAMLFSTLPCNSANEMKCMIFAFLAVTHTGNDIVFQVRHYVANFAISCRTANPFRSIVPLQFSKKFQARNNYAEVCTLHIENHH